MADWQQIKQQLERPFDANRIHWRVGATNAKKNGGKASKGIALAYIDARDVMKRLDDVVGLHWQSRYTLADSGLLICEIGLKIGDEWLWRANGAGDTDVEAEKGKASDAFKRAAVLWGVGRYLYSLPNTWVEVNEWKQITKPPALPAWATPEGYDALMAKRAAA